MKIAIGQINPIIADLSGNVQKCLAAAQGALKAEADLLILPEMALTGCPTGDILLDRSFVQASWEALQDLAGRLPPHFSTLVGTVLPSGQQTAYHPGLWNLAVLIQNNTPRPAAYKRVLRPDDVYNEMRWFQSGPFTPPLEIGGRKIGVVFGSGLAPGENLLDQAAEQKKAGAELLVCLAAEPYQQGGVTRRLERARLYGLPLVFANPTGANDEIIYDGRSFMLDSGGRLIVQLAAFEQDLQVIEENGFGHWSWIDRESGELVSTAVEIPQLDSQEELFKALALGVADFADKNRLERAFVGVSGGIDSAVTAAIACQALGPRRVTAVSIPSRFTDPRSVESAGELCKSLGCLLEVIDLEPLHQAAETSLKALLTEVTGSPGTIQANTGAENIQARLRAMILMSYVNRYGGFLLNTTNKTELSVGYITLYGDMAGSLSPLGDLTKPEVFALAHWLNEKRGCIPDFILERPPTAELSTGQVDPFDYAEISPRLEALVQANRVNEALRRSEYKRSQMGIILKVKEKSFGSGRIMPITRR